MNPPQEPEYPEEYYEHLARILGQEQADWARLPRAERERELTWLHAHFDTPDDLATWPPELGGSPFKATLPAHLPSPAERDAEKAGS